MLRRFLDAFRFFFFRRDVQISTKRPSELTLFYYGEHVYRYSISSFFSAEYESTEYGCQLKFFPVPVRAPENLVSRDGFDRPVPRQPAHSPHSGSICSLLTGFLPISATASIYLCRQPPSAQSRVTWVTQLRTGGGDFTAESPPAQGQ